MTRRQRYEQLEETIFTPIDCQRIMFAVANKQEQDIVHFICCYYGLKLTCSKPFGFVTIDFGFTTDELLKELL